jgi:hypothetical protein
MSEDNPWEVLGATPLDFSDGVLPVNFHTELPQPKPWPQPGDLEVLFGPSVKVADILIRLM